MNPTYSLDRDSGARGQKNTIHVSVDFFRFIKLETLLKTFKVRYWKFFRQCKVLKLGTSGGGGYLVVATWEAFF
jgi:hypothetical protein